MGVVLVLAKAGANEKAVRKVNGWRAAGSCRLGYEGLPPPIFSVFGQLRWDYARHGRQNRIGLVKIRLYFHRSCCLTEGCRRRARNGGKRPGCAWPCSGFLPASPALPRREEPPLFRQRLALVSPPSSVPPRRYHPPFNSAVSAFAKSHFPRPISGWDL